tara:strand:+ start:366 stop:743 length:378 start_codon:yes stop_codon:yes gene_type:complete
MSKSSITLAFLTLVKQLNEELLKMYPDDIHFKMSKTTIIMFETTNTTRQMINSMGQYLCLYSNYILTRDERFFLTKDLSEHDEENILIMNKLKEYWITFNNKEKDHVWQYLENMFKLYTKLIELK